MNADFLAQVPEWIARVQRAQSTSTDIAIPIAAQKHFRCSKPQPALLLQLNDAQQNALQAILEGENQPLYRYLEMPQVPAQRIQSGRNLTLDELISGALDYFICEYVAEHLK